MNALAAAAETRPAVLVEGEVFVPAYTGTLEGFTRWAHSDAFPESGRIDFLQGTIEVEMGPEDLQTHSNPKNKIQTAIDRVVEEADLGQVFGDRVRLRSGPAGLSCEPDVLFVSWEALQKGLVQYVRAASREPGRFIEVEGAADLAVEVVSDGSVKKDMERLPPLYARAGVRELWLVDARSEPIRFQILHRHGNTYRRARPDADGYQLSRVLDRRLRLRREPGRLPETWRYFVDVA